ncbi:glycosyltransferase family 2 protein [Castellaniella sp.]|uniref:glycosyltransferase family 2 protein n=1 Tax=Castellaniella sp. TaxID=1955812 RepID=UPI002AFE88C1|nr:glycosyltransferase family 2 protein [Castellaniella sp.]
MSEQPNNTHAARTHDYAARGWIVPAMTVETFAPKQQRHALIIPVINEGERIRRQIAQIAEGQHARHCDIIIVDGGSTDGSLAPEVLHAAGVRTLLTKTGPGKLSAQLRCAYAYALAEGYEGLITIDGNGKDSVETIPAFNAALDAGVDYAQASRFIAGGKGVNTPALRLIAIRAIHAPVLSLAGRRWLTDTTQGYRAYSARYMLDPCVQPFRDIFVRYELLAYLTARAGQLGYRVLEIPTTRAYPANEPVPTKIGGLKAYSDLMSVLWKTLSGAFDPPSTRP